jgi:hypothetical protein
MHPDLAGIKHAEAENVTVLDRAGVDDLGEKADPNARQLAGLAAGEGSRLRRCSSRSAA